jgi:hypothetical protein
VAFSFSCFSSLLACSCSPSCTGNTGKASAVGPELPRVGPPLSVVVVDQVCNRTPCSSEPFWTTPSDWSKCSQPCVDAVVGLNGTSTAGTPPVCLQDAGNGAGPVPVDSSLCSGAPAVTTRACNQFPCPNSVAAWGTTDWGVCVPPSEECGGGVGTRSREFVCLSPEGAVVPTGCTSSPPPVRLHLRVWLELVWLCHRRSGGPWEAVSPWPTLQPHPRPQWPLGPHPSRAFRHALLFLCL